MFLSFLHAFMYMLLGQALVFISVCFANGVLLPSVFGGVYEAIPNVWARIGLCLLSTYALANYCIPKGYSVTSASVAGAAFLIASCLMTVITAVLVEQVKINVHIILGTLIMSMGSAYVVYGLHGGQALTQQ